LIDWSIEVTPMPPAPERDDEVLERALSGALYRVDCPPPHALGEYELDLLETQQRIEVARHLTECDACRAELLEARTFLGAEIEVSEPLVGWGRRIVAALLAPRAGPAYALRGAAQAGNLVYAVEGITLSLSVGRGTLSGLVVAEGYSSEQLQGRVVRLVNGPATSLDDLSGFDFTEVPSGVYTLEMDLPDNTVVVEALPL
jgi:hypothetical protein